MPARKEYVGLQTTPEGYEQWHDRIAGKTITVHQLLAIADGADPYKVFSSGEWHVHHDNEIPWDNRPKNLGLLTRTEHLTHHAPEKGRGQMFDSSVCSSLRDQYEDNTITELSDEYELSTTCVFEHLNGDCAHHDEPVTKGFDGPRDGPWRDRETFEQLYVDDGLTYTQLSDVWDCSLATISNWASKHGISG